MDFYESKMPRAMKFIWGLTLVGGLLGMSLFMYILFVAFVHNPKLRNETSIPELKSTYAFHETSEQKGHLYYDEEDEEEPATSDPSNEPEPSPYYEEEPDDPEDF